METSDNVFCRDCGANLPPGIAGAMCPRCAMSVGLETPTELCEKPGDSIGGYKLIHLLGEGGMGRVWLAEQKQPMRQMVALKVLKAGMDSAEILARFESERQALALMDHPNIARIFAGGATPLGRPFFVMELVKGVPLTQFCDEERLSISERLELFTQVCHAVQHAHQKGIIHRDLKPSNVLVALYDGQPVPKVIDFGVAKALGQRLTNRTLYTLPGHMVGTLEYMSPEQAELNQIDIDTRSDVYSLGVLLYELLTGTTPLTREALRQAALEEVLRRIRDEEPLKPSLRLSTSRERLPVVSAQRKLEPESLTRVIQGELDWIVMKALEKDRNRRYEAANALASELERYLNNEPVLAGPPTGTYRLKKFILKHWRPVILGTSLIASLGIATIISALSATSANRERERANKLATQEAQQRRREQLAVTHLEIERADSLLALGSSSRGLASLARVIRREPTNRVAAERLVNALNNGNFCIPVASLPHDGPLQTTQLSPDASTIVTLLDNSTAQLWDIRTQLSIGPTLRHHAAIVWCHFSPDGQCLITASEDKTAKVWNCSTGKQQGASLLHKAPLRFARFGTDCSRAVTVTTDNTLHAWDLNSGVLLCTITNRTNILWACLTPSGEQILLGERNIIRVFDSQNAAFLTNVPHRLNWELPTSVPEFSRDGSMLTTFSTGDVAIRNARVKGFPVITRIPLSDNPSCAVFSPDGRSVLTACIGETGNYMRLWDALTGQPRGPAIEHEDAVLCARFDKTGNLAVSSSRDKTVRIWEPHSGRPISEPIHNSMPTWLAAFTSDSDRIITVGEPGYVYIWRICQINPPGKTLQAKGNVRHAAFSKKGDRIAVGSTQMVRVNDVETGQTLNDFAGDSLMHVVRFSPDSKKIVGVSDKPTFKIWDLFTGQLVAEAPPQCRNAHICNAQYNPDGTRLVIATAKTSWILNSADCTIVHELLHTNAQYAEFNPDGTIVVTAARDGTARVWNTATGRLITVLPHNDEVWWAEFNGDGKQIVTASKDRTARVWDSLTGQMLIPPLVHADPLVGRHCVQFSPDGNRIVTASGNAAQVWNSRTGEPVIPPIRHHGRVSSVRFSPEGKRIVTSSLSGDARVWDAETGLPISDWSGQGRSVFYAEFHTSGNLVITASAGGFARLWETPFISGEIPTWLPSIAEAIAGHSIDEQNTTSFIPTERLFRLIHEINDAPTNRSYHWIKWLFNTGTKTSLIDSVVKPYLPVAALAPRPDYQRSSVIQVIFGETNQEQGLYIREGGDSKHVTTNIDSQSAWFFKSGWNYCYFLADPAFQQAVGSNLFVRVEFRGGGGKPPGVHYHKDTNIYTVAKASSVSRGKWDVAEFFLKDARFCNSQNFGSDFRIYDNRSGFYLRSVTVAGLPDEAALQNHTILNP